ncbi:MAG: site-specific DNA-methyltransferase [Selenomonadaceae bacterium]|nr:site-specific DNA-methyltransferase [Selenomonadaceae bacterium]
MPVLDWLGKEKVINHHLDVPFRFLDKKFSVGASENKIIHGDNLLALKSLLPEFAGRVKCIYIDPPYNTGNENWIYNDAVNDPQINRWLGQVVGKEGEDLTRHDKWLCMMYPRLRLLQKLLANDGAIFISIDDNEQANLKLICDEIFGAQNFVDIFSWKKTETPANLSTKTKKAIEYILCYTKNNGSIKFRGLKKDSKSSNGLMNQTNSAKELTFPPDCVDTALPDGIYFKGEYGTPAYKIFLLDDTEVINGIFTKPIRLHGKFKWSQEKLNDELSRGTKISIRTKAFSPSYEREEYEPEVPWNIIDKSFGVQTNEHASAELKKIFDGYKVFDFPKPHSLIEYLINFLGDKNSIVLDSFAGSGTTAHAVINLNAQDGGNRKFILIELNDYAESITAERVKRVGGNFDFFELGAELFDDDGFINAEIPREKLFDYVYFAETHKHFTPSDEEFLLGVDDCTAYYFFDDEELNFDLLAKIRTKAATYVIYAANCTLADSELDEFNITFKKIPRDIPKL